MVSENIHTSPQMVFPHPLGISTDHPRGRYGYFLEPHNANLATLTVFSTWQCLCCLSYPWDTSFSFFHLLLLKFRLWTWLWQHKDHNRSILFTFWLSRGLSNTKNKYEKVTGMSFGISTPIVQPCRGGYSFESPAVLAVGLCSTSLKWIPPNLQNWIRDKLKDLKKNSPWSSRPWLAA